MKNLIPFFILGAGGIAMLYYASKPDIVENIITTTSTETIEGTFQLGSLVAQIPFTQAHDIDVLARTIYGEARGESTSGKIAVANVVMNRYNEARQASRFGRLFGKTIAGICQKPYQFSCWNRNDPNYTLITQVKRGNPVFDECYKIAAQAVQGLLPDAVNGATYYHTSSIKPSWVGNNTPVAVVASHKFYTSTQIG